MSHLLQTLSPAAALPFELVRGAGAQLFTADGTAYWDFYGGHAVALLGQGHPGWVQAIGYQASTLSFVTTVAPLSIREQAAARLAAFAGLDRAFFVNSGAEANEAALKVARKATGRSTIVAMEHGFHGRTMACLGVTQSGSYRSQHAPVHGEPRFVPFGDLDALVEALDEDVAAVLVEPLQGIAGVLEPPAGYLTAVRAACDAVGALLIVDEVQTGVGRTGRPFRFQVEDCRPDLVTCGKSLGNGFPVAALLLTEAMAATTKPGEHGSTFGGGPLACAAVLAVLDAIEQEELLPRANAIAAWVRSLAPGGERAIPGVVAVRGDGCLLGLVLDRPAKPVAAQLRDQAHILTGTAHDPHCLRLCPPATLPDDALTALEAALRTALETP